MGRLEKETVDSLIRRRQTKRAQRLNVAGRTHGAGRVACGGHGRFVVGSELRFGCRALLQPHGGVEGGDSGSRLEQGSACSVA